MNKSDICIRDPFILLDKDSEVYYLYGTTDKNVWSGNATGFDAYSSKDLNNWDGPFSVFRPTADFWATKQYWAPEVYKYNNNYYMFASFKSEDKCRGTQILLSETPLGPFLPLTEEPVTPKNWECLDGTLYIDESNNPWMIFCHEWVQVKDGELCAIQLSKDLRESISDPITLFTASEAKWTRGNVDYVTDGPFLYKDHQGNLLMLWSSMGEKGYAIGVSRSESGSIIGPWIHDDEPFFNENGGHGMMFKTIANELILTFHSPNSQSDERPVFYSINEENGLSLGGKI